MCKHILNAQVAIRAPCCKRWFDCAECHQELVPDHPLQRTVEMTFACKKCKKVFRKDMEHFEESDEYCPSCDNHFYIEAKTPETEGQLVIQLEGSADMIRDSRQKQKHAVGASSMFPPM
eukprot:TRINITY_DN8057_c0_g1_i1.p1 TRINITY_DN8057_c0_g1~~TRINITY_DN8057_c0_g1_i1.p1  ORF type:complete len:119 (-),score=18.26 TRINITY_DN8057_c0_g1_i1:141-497(-)